MAITETYKLPEPVHHMKFTLPSAVDVSGRRINLQVSRPDLYNFGVRRYPWPFGGSVHIEAPIETDAKVHGVTLTYTAGGWAPEYVAEFKRKMSAVPEEPAQVM